MHDSELIIRARQKGRHYELLPLHTLENDFPQALVQDYAHWLDLKTGFVEWCPITDAWTHSSCNWQMRPGSQRENVLVRGPLRLIDFYSPTAQAVSSLLGSLEHATHIHITIHCETEVLEVHLPRLKLDFFLGKHALHLESKQFRGMIVDPDQSFGTMTGLANKLVLRGKHDSSRNVIIPHGEVEFSPRGHHVDVQIHNSSRQVSYHLYNIDRQLGRLVDNGSLKSKLFKCYLHAVTAHCLIDELTGRTGVEESLSTLASASVRSSFKLEQVEIDLLVLLAQLTPHREYYPRHLKVMQTIAWKKISPLSQHNSFCILVQSIFEQARRYSQLDDQPLELPDANLCGDQCLLERAAIRDSTSHVHGFGAEAHTTEHDVVYTSRDYVSNSPREFQVFLTAKLVDGWSANLRVVPHLLREIESWREPLGGCRIEDTLSVGYDMKWLDPLVKFLPNDWCTLQKTLSSSVAQRDKYRIMWFLATLAYSQHAKQELVQTLLAFVTVPELRAIGPPDYPMFQLCHGFGPDRKILIGITRKWIRPYNSCPESKLPSIPFETFQQAEKRRKSEHQIAMEKCLGAYVDALICQSHEASVHNPAGGDFDTYILVNEATEDARTWFQSWYRNAKFQKYVGQLQKVLDDLVAPDENLPLYFYSQPYCRYSSKLNHIDFDDLLRRPAPSLSLARLENFDPWIDEQPEAQEGHSKLKSLLIRLLAECPSGYEQRYAIDLMKSFGSLHETVDVKLNGPTEALKPLLESHLRLCKGHVDHIYKMICHCLQEEVSFTRQLACAANMWPRLSTISLLQNLAGDKVVTLPDEWKGALIEYGLAISHLQRAERLLARLGDDLELLSELSNPGHQGWNPMHHPDWLLLEVESNILIRPVQAQIADEMISPSSGTNSIMQLNMGEGKSSVIVPIVAAALADGKKLVRVVVLRQLSTQMFHLLSRKLSGLLNRRIFHMPISRSTQLDIQKARQIQILCEECRRTGGILLVQPEHLLSFELMGLDKLLSGELELGNVLTATNRWLQDNSRDILDESDEILSVRFELVYTMGTQRAIEFSPDRWIIIQHILGLVNRFVEAVSQQFPGGLELKSVHPGSFPHSRILQSQAADKLLEMIGREVCEAGLPGVPVWNFPQDVRAVLFRLLTENNMSEEQIVSLQQKIFAVESMKRSVLLIRGLLAGGILAFALQQKRWRVNYGLDLSRTMLAVPYRAKDIPATRAEFSHPDAAIVLTCLSYYYGGLSDEQLHTAFEKLLVCDYAQEEYQGWVQNTKLPPAFRKLSGVNLSDSAQCSRLVFPLLRHVKGVIDFYMSTIVFPKEMKDFPHKLSSSGWDIARTKIQPTTGFSGTNDSRYMLPLSISQRDLPQQLHTNAKVLDYLLRPENFFRRAKPKSGSESLNADLLLQMVIESESPVRVILDVGAQVLEWTNEEVARRWLSRVPASEAQAAVFFNDRNDLSVLSRDDLTESLMISPFAKQMDQCLVYLDESHTRGTDLPLPLHYRAAVTLGPDLTKDRLVQGMTRPHRLLFSLLT